MLGTVLQSSFVVIRPVLDQFWEKFPGVADPARLKYVASITTRSSSVSMAARMRWTGRRRILRSEERSQVGRVVNKCGLQRGRKVGSGRVGLAIIETGSLTDPA